MYSAYQSAIRVCLADALLVLAVGGRGTPRALAGSLAKPKRHGRIDAPGSRVVTSWNSQPLPSGSLNETNEP